MTATELVKEQAQARRDATRRDKFIECLKKDTVDIGKSVWSSSKLCRAQSGLG